MNANASAASFTPEARRDLLAAYVSAKEAEIEVAEALHGVRGTEAVRLGTHVAYHERRAARALAAYREGLPRAVVARCPFTQALAEHSLDSFGLDGLWWRHEAPVRPAERLPPTFLALTGALALGHPVESAEWLVKPGPEAPFVVPALLADGVEAVLRETPVGPHRGFAVSYFAKRAPRGFRPPPAWGSAQAFLPGTSFPWDAPPLSEADCDFDLAPWIRSRKLRWIRADDPSHALHDAVDGCPYLGLPGRRAFVRVRAGRAWTAGAEPEARR